MDLLDIYEKTILILLLVISLVILIVNFLLIKNNQRKLQYLHPGWLLNLLIAFYGLTTPIYILFNSKDYFKMNSNFINLYSFEKFSFILILYILVLLIFSFSELVLLYYLKKQPSAKMEGLKNLKGWEKQSIRASVKVLLTLLILIILYNISLLGGFNSNAIIDKVTRYETLEESGTTIPYTPLYQVIFLFWFYHLVKYNLWSNKNKIMYWATFMLFTFFILYMGTTLQILLVVLGKIFILFAYKREYLLSKKKFVIFSLFTLATVFISIQNYRDVISSSLSQDINLFSLFQFPDLSRFETITGYIPGLVLLSDSGIFEKQDFIGSILSILPGSILNGIIDQNYNLTELINNSSYNTSYGTYTVTMPISLYWTSGIVGLILFAFIIYLVSFYSIKFCYNNGHYFRFISVILYCNLFYLMRIDTSSWFGKLRLDVFFTVLVIIISWIIYQTFKSYFYRTRGITSIQLKGEKR